MRRTFTYVSILLILSGILLVFIFPGWVTIAVLLFLVVVLGMGWHDMIQKSDNIRRQYPLFGRLSRLLEKERHILQETFLQNSTEGKPFTILQQKIVAKKAEDKLKNFAFGTELDYYQADKTWWKHSMYPALKHEEDLRVSIGGPECLQPYSCSIFNIGAMSYGSISNAAIRALSGGASLNNFALNTGEGGLTSYHEEHDADIIFQFGTAYFGCRDSDGNFDEQEFSEIARRKNVKMIEIKISQGAKPGYGAILPASKNTEEIARIRKIKPYKEVLSPPHHSSFGNARELGEFISRLRKLSEGKPIGVKFCLGREEEFREMCLIWKDEKLSPDFISMDGGEGGTGAGDTDAIHYVGMPLKRALPIVHRILKEENIRERIKIFVAGKIISSYDIVELKTMGADLFYSGRGMMFALGCVQSLKCNTNNCPTGVATMDPQRIKALEPSDKKYKVANYHRNTVEGIRNLLKAAGLRSFEEVSENHIGSIND